ncbi:MAG: NAD-dependent epimerase/dehydratase family protein [Myxococcota bacterium]
MRIFVTGGNGFIGSHVVKTLLSKGYQVRCLLRPTSDTKRLSGLDYEPVLGDVRHQDSLTTGMSGCDGIVHLASLSSWNDIASPAMHEIVVSGSKNLFQAAKAHGISKTVFVSSAAAINGSKTPELQNEDSTFSLEKHHLPYSKAKRAVEQMDFPFVTVNPGEVYGPNDWNFITAGNLVDFAESAPVMVCAGGTSVVHVEDVASGIVAALEKGRIGQRYILGGDNLTIRELAKLTLDILGQNKRILQIPNGLLRIAGKTASALKLPFPIHPNVIPYATRYWMMDNEKAKRELGVSFRNARDTLEPTLMWLKNEGLI